MKKWLANRPPEFWGLVVFAVLYWTAMLLIRLYVQ